MVASVAAMPEVHKVETTDTPAGVALAAATSQTTNATVSVAR